MQAVRSTGLVLHLVTCMNQSTTLIDWLTSVSIMPTAQLHTLVKKILLFSTAANTLHVEFFLQF
jgi:hypothetical protein